MILYRAVRGAILGFCRLWFRLTIEGRENVPADGAFVLAPVHRSFMDFGFVSGVTRRRLRYMGKAELWKSALFGRLLSALGAFPVHRGGADREALRRTIEVVQGGEPVVIFPEGTRRYGPVVEDLYEGAAYVAARAGIPIVPVGIGGSERAMAKGHKIPRPDKVHVIVGRPLPPPESVDGRVPRRAVHELTQQLQVEVQRLFDAAQAKVGAA